jgi:hypothetical protein
MGARRGQERQYPQYRATTPPLQPQWIKAKDRRKRLRRKRGGHKDFSWTY